MDFHYPEIPKKDFIHEDKCCTSGLGTPTGSEACCRTKRFGAVSYSPSIVTMVVSVAVCEIFSVKEWCDLENRVRVHSRSLEMAPFDKSHTSSYSPSIVSMAISLSFARYSDLLVENREIFIPHLYLAPPQRMTPSEFREDV